MNSSLKEIDVVILCGGRGRRLRSLVSGRPKPMAEIKHQPFLNILIDHLAGFGLRRFILCIGYMGNFIKKHCLKRDDLEILFSEEKKPLGTGGAVKNAKPFIRSSPFLVLNGDALFKVGFKKFFNFHSRNTSLITIAFLKARNTIDQGRVRLNGLRQIVSFQEKIRAVNTGYINAEVYLFEKQVFSFMPKNTMFSLEKYFFPWMATQKRIFGYISKALFIDIGTPKRYRKAHSLLKKNVSQLFIQ